MCFYVRIDGASETHAVCVLGDRGGVRWQGSLAHSAAGLAELLGHLRRFGPGLAIALDVCRRVQSRADLCQPRVVAGLSRRIELGPEILGRHTDNLSTKPHFGRLGMGRSPCPPSGKLGVPGGKTDGPEGAAMYLHEYAASEYISHPRRRAMRGQQRGDDCGCCHPREGADRDPA